MPKADQEVWRDAWRSRRPLATDDFRHGVYRMSRAEAEFRRYVEHSPTALLSMLIADVDRPDALLRAFQKPHAHPVPSWVSESPSGHGHVGWLLKTPVVRTDSARLAPMKLAAKVEEGLRRCVDGDINYAGLLTKNPLHPDWVTTWGTDHLYDLQEMKEALGELMPRSLPRRAADSSGLGRNVALFNRERLWAYRARLRYDDRAEWEEVAYAYGVNVNLEFAVPLPLGEVEHTARSVARWTWRHFSAETFAAIQSSRGRKGGSKVTEAKVAANRQRATKVDRSALLGRVRNGC